MGRQSKKGRKRKKAARRSVIARMGGVLGAFAVGEELDEETSSHLREIAGLVLMGLSAWLFLSMASFAWPYGAAEGGNWGGQAGYYLAEWVFIAIGRAGYMLVFLGIAWGIVLVARRQVAFPTLRITGAIFFLFFAALFAELAFGGGGEPSLPFGPGGWLALELLRADPETGREAVLVAKFGSPGLWVLLTLGTLVSFMLATEMAFYPAVVALRDWLVRRRDEAGESRTLALLGWIGRLFVGLWSFMRGRDLEAGSATVAVPATVGRRRRPPRLPAGTPAQPAELFTEDTRAEDEDEDEEETEWEIVDEPDEPDEPDEEDEEDDEDEEYEEDDEEAAAYEEEGEEEVEEEEDEPEEVIAPRPRVSQVQVAQDFEPPQPPPGPWRFPPLELLEPPGAAGREDEAAVEHAARKLENVLRSFRVEAVVVGAKVGATVTMFELEVAQGTRLNKVTQLSQEIAAALRAKSVRIIAPIPGKSTIGIEVPNVKRRLVRLSELITQKAYDKKFMSLPLFLGVTADGSGVIEDLARMPHLLIAGTTGSGKSVCINTVLASLLLTRSPHDVKMILVDPKMVELQMFSRMPHLMLPVVSDMRQATNVLLWAVEKMEGRYEIFQAAGVRNIKAYNALGEEQLRQRLGDDFSEERTPRHVPYIVIVIDEMADLMMTSKKEAEQAITRLAQKSRAVGIHVIVATQRPSTDVITGVIKGNLPTRIAFQVASKVDSRVILDTMGAEKLLGQGDMLFSPPQTSQIMRVQGALVEDHEIQAIVDFVSKESLPSFSQELVQSATGTAPAGAAKSGAEQDDLWDEAVRVILKSRRGSASLLQRALGIGYTRASRLIDLMTAEGIVGAYKGSKAREVMLSIEDWEEMHGTPIGEGRGASDD